MLSFIYYTRINNTEKILEQVGFKKEGTLRKHNIKNNKPVNVIVHSIIG